jgi:CheY-like chemotaxis protein
VRFANREESCPPTGECFINVTFRLQISCLMPLPINPFRRFVTVVAPWQTAKWSTIGRRILVVDDDSLVCDAIRLILASDGHHVETATSSEAALAQFKTSSFDLVIVDYQLPAMKGDKLAEAIKALHPNLPIALITAYAESLQSARVPLPGVDLVIGKPFDTVGFRQAIAGLLSGEAAN